MLMMMCYFVNIVSIVWILFELNDRLQDWKQHGQGFYHHMMELDKKAEGDLLNDQHINYAQWFIQIQFPNNEGLGHTLLQEKKDVERIVDYGLQIIFDRNNHWLYLPICMDV